jgi:regulator of protease activity HflC (stomatin/prohibitin superfamily)
MKEIITTITALISLMVVFKGVPLGGEKTQKIVRLLALLIAIPTVLASVMEWFAFIPAGKVGVVEVWGKVSQRPLQPGIYWKNPLGEVIEFSTRLQDIKETVEATSKEGLTFKIDVSLQYRIDPQKAGDIYQNLGTEQREIIISRFRSIIRRITANYNAQDIYSEKRQIVEQQLTQKLRENLSPLGFVVEEVLLRNLILPENLQASIQQKLQAEQENEKLDLELKKAAKEAKRKRIEAQGNADAQKILSQGLTEQVLRLKSIEATEKLAQSQNAKIIILGGNQNQLPFILQEK